MGAMKDHPLVDAILSKQITDATERARQSILSDSRILSNRLEAAWGEYRKSSGVIKDPRYRGEIMTYAVPGNAPPQTLSESRLIEIKSVAEILRRGAERNAAAIDNPRFIPSVQLARAATIVDADIDELLRDLRGARETARASVVALWIRVLFVSFAITGLLLASMWLKQQSDEAWIRHVQSTAGADEVYQQVRHNRGVSLGQIVNHLSRKPLGFWSGLIFGRSVNRHTMEPTARALLDELMGRGAITRQGPGLTDTYSALLPS